MVLLCNTVSVVKRNTGGVSKGAYSNENHYFAFNWCMCYYIIVNQSS